MLLVRLLSRCCCQYYTTRWAGHCYVSDLLKVGGVKADVEATLTFIYLKLCLILDYYVSYVFHGACAPMWVVGLDQAVQQGIQFLE